MLVVGSLSQFPLSYLSAITSCNNVWWNCVVQYLNKTLNRKSVLSLFDGDNIFFLVKFIICVTAYNPAHNLDNQVTTRGDERLES